MHAKQSGQRTQHKSCIGTSREPRICDNLSDGAPVNSASQWRIPHAIHNNPCPRKQEIMSRTWRLKSHDDGQGNKHGQRSCSETALRNVRPRQDRAGEEIKNGKRIRQNRKSRMPCRNALCCKVRCFAGSSMQITTIRHSRTSTNTWKSHLAKSETPRIETSYTLKQATRDVHTTDETGHMKPTCTQAARQKNDYRSSLLCIHSRRHSASARATRVCRGNSASASSDCSNWPSALT